MDSARFESMNTAMDEPHILRSEDLLDDLVNRSRLTVVTFIVPEDAGNRRQRSAMRKITRATRDLLAQENLREREFVLFVEVNVFEHEAVVRQFRVNPRQLPTVLFFKNDKELKRLEGFSNALVYMEIAYQLLGIPVPPRNIKASPCAQFVDPNASGTISEEVRKNLSDLVNKHNIMLIMSGDVLGATDEGSKTALRVLIQGGVPFGVHNIDSDPVERDNLMRFAKFKIPFPHVYLDGIMVGGIESFQELEITENIRLLFEEH